MLAGSLRRGWPAAPATLSAALTCGGRAVDLALVAHILGAPSEQAQICAMLQW